RRRLPEPTLECRHGVEVVPLFVEELCWVRGVVVSDMNEKQDARVEPWDDAVVPVLSTSLTFSSDLRRRPVPRNRFRELQPNLPWTSGSNRERESERIALRHF